MEIVRGCLLHVLSALCLCCLCTRLNPQLASGSHLFTGTVKSFDVTAFQTADVTFLIENICSSPPLSV